MHTLIVGPPGVGKSTLIRRVLAELGRPVFGCESKKEDALATAELGSPVYLYKAGAERRQTPDNLAGWVRDRRPTPIRETFDRHAPGLRAPIPPGHVVLLDEIGTMESVSADFCAAVLSLLDGRAPVIAAVKQKDTPYLTAVRSHPNCRCFFITEENREALFGEVLAFIQAQFPPE